jgi:hypothetical protein
MDDRKEFLIKRHGWIEVEDRVMWSKEAPGNVRSLFHLCKEEEEEKAFSVYGWISLISGNICLRCHEEIDEGIVKKVKFLRKIWEFSNG